MSLIITSAEAKRIAEQAFEAGLIIKQTDTFALYQLPQGKTSLLGNYMLMVFFAGYDFPEGKVTDGLVIPVDIKGRHGYLLEESVAKNYQA